MRLPGEHRDKKKCREGGGRMDSGGERRGGEDRSEVYQGWGWGEEEGEVEEVEEDLK